MEALSGLKVLLQHSFNLDGRWRWMVNVPPPNPLYPWEKDRLIIVRKIGWAMRTLWTCMENLEYTGLRTPIYPARSEWLHTCATQTAP
jgi:hypothetical protein